MKKLHISNDLESLINKLIDEKVNRPKVIYSPNEIILGVDAHDNKLVYQKEITMDSLPNTTGSLVPTGLPSTYEVIDVTGKAISTISGNVFPLPFVSTDTDKMELVYLNTNREVRVTTYMDRRALRGIFYIKYKKPSEN